MKLDAPMSVLKVLQDAINDVRSARTKEDVMMATSRANAIAYCSNVWLGGYDKHVILKKVEQSEAELERIEAHLHLQAGATAALKTKH